MWRSHTYDSKSGHSDPCESNRQKGCCGHTENSAKEEQKMRWIKAAVVILWSAVLVFFFLHRKDFTLDSLMNARPDNLFAAALFMLGMFALKSMTFFFYSGLLYLADGMLFPFPIALLVSLMGAWIMVSLPYGIGRWLGKDARARLLDQYPKLQALDAFQSDNEFFSILLARVIGRLPSDLVSLYFGASQAKYGIYALASVLCCIPHMITYPLMGANIKTPGSPEFIFALVFEIVWAAGCFLAYKVYEKHHPKAAASR